ncbi:MAG TPA: HXXEE domain-containing protein [Pyrinomonadaceae bacterium]|nr:HXXEE domain-containing protein [Pyrinomonadaceae bacterium]
MPLLAWSLAIAASVHIFEEFVFPGGFKAWWCAYKPGIAPSVSNNFLIVINAILIAFSILVAVAVQVPKGNGIAAWLTLAALLFSNAIFHIIGAVQTKRYSPGMISGIVLYIPLAVYGFIHFLANGQASIGTALIALLLGGSYHFISFANHRRRAQTARAK